MNRRKFLLQLGATGLALPLAPNLMASSLLANNSNFADFQRQQTQGFTSFKEAQEKDFAAYQQAINQEFNRFKGQVNKLWGDTNLGSAKVFVSYSDDLKTRRILDFAQGSLTIEKIAPKGSANLGKELRQELVTTASSNLNQAFNNSKLDTSLEAATQKASSNATQGKPGNQPLIADALTGTSQPSPQATQQAVLTQAKEGKASTRPAKQPGQEVFVFSIPLGAASLSNKANTYKPLVIKYAKAEQLDPALVMAIMHSESSFNPMAKSHVPAYGLMQIVPTSAGKDASQKVYGQQRLLSPSYLYNADNNIKMGCAYLNILNYRYLAAIKNPESRAYCVICAYNTGAGNVAKAFTGKTNVSQAAVKINQLSPSQVYNHLLRNLRYAETRNYLKVVTPRYKGYQGEFA